MAFECKYLRNNSMKNLKKLLIKFGLNFPLLIDALQTNFFLNILPSEVGPLQVLDILLLTRISDSPNWQKHGQVEA